MQALRTYLKEMAVLIDRPARLVPLVIAMGTLLGLMDIVCLALLASLVGGISRNTATITIGPEGYNLALDVTQAGFLLVAIYVTRAILGISFNYVIFRHTGRAEASLRARIIERFMRMPYERRLKRSLGSLVTAANQWTMSFVRGVLAPALRFISDSMVGLLILVYFILLYPKAVLLFLVSAVTLAFIYDRTLRRLSTESARKFRTLSEEIAENTEQALAGYKEIRVLNLAAFFRKEIHERSERMARALAVANTIGQSSRLIIEAMMVIIGVGLLLTIARSGQSIAEQLPQVAMLAFALLRVSSLVSLATAAVANLRLYRGVVHQLYGDLSEAMLDEQKAGPTPDFVGLELKAVDFNYDGIRTPILRNVNFTLKTGEALAIVGDSGSGKTTLVDLMLGILQPTAGSIRVTVKHNDVSSENPNLLGVATYLSQAGFVLNDTIRHNVALGEQDAAIDDARVIEALKKAKLDAFATLEQLNLRAGDRGAKLSGGQRQRLVLARAFYHGHKVMILDEATNAIDLTTEIEIVKDLLAICPEVTLITITHRPEIARLFPRILDLSKAAIERRAS